MKHNWMPMKYAAKISTRISGRQVAYREDGEAIKEATEHLEKKMKEFKDGLSKESKKEIDELKEAYEKEQKALEVKVKELTTKVAEQDGTIGDQVEEVKNLKARGGRFSGGSAKFEGLRFTIANSIAHAIGEAREDIKTSASGTLMKPVEIKTVANIASANLTVDNFISYLDWRPGMEPTGQYHFRNIVRTIVSETDYVQFPRANTPIGEGSFGRVAEAATKPQVDRDYTMVNLTLQPMAAYAICSRQSLRNILFLQSWLPESMMNQLEESEDTDFANALVAAATGSSTTTGITVANERLIFMLKNLMVAKFNPTAIYTDPSVWAQILVTKPVDYSLPNVVTVDTNGVTRILGRPLIPVNWLTGNRVLLGDFTKAAIVQSEGLRLRQSDSHASLFTSNEIAFLLERTEGLAIFRPDAFITAIVS